MRKISLILTLFGLILFATPAFAGWANYYVIAAGPYENTSVPAVGKIMSVQLQPVAGGSVTFFRLDSSIENVLMAVALTAVSTGQPVRANIEHNYSNLHWSDYEVITLWLYDSAASLP